jgi:TRAP-type mannitol/chloroaromatic compound transport system substrate-binding protein
MGVLTARAPIAKAKSIFNWKMVTAWPKNYPGLDTNANLQAKMITELSGGRIPPKFMVRRN